MENQEIKNRILENEAKIGSLRSEISYKKIIWGAILLTIALLSFALSFLGVSEIEIFNKVNRMFILFIGLSTLGPGLYLTIFGSIQLSKINNRIEQLENENKQLNKSLKNQQ